MSPRILSRWPGLQLQWRLHWSSVRHLPPILLPAVQQMSPVPLPTEGVTADCWGGGVVCSGCGGGALGRQKARWERANHRWRNHLLFQNCCWVLSGSTCLAASISLVQTCEISTSTRINIQKGSFIHTLQKTQKTCSYFTSVIQANMQTSYST